MRWPTAKTSFVLLGLLILAVSAWLLFYHECASGGAMGGRYQECSCRGIEVEDFDQTAADGPRRTICLGRVTQRTCFRDRFGPEIPCKSR